ncbi:MAG: alpha-L-fucosidase [Planctomycetota bacterium]
MLGHDLRSVMCIALLAAPAPGGVVEPPAPFGAVPSERQLCWHELEFYGFVHFTVNTFTDKEWGFGDESPALFNPAALDARQWTRVARDAGMRGLIATAKHHDGFCLWPSKYTEHSVKSSPWKAGKGDVLRELADACREFGLAFGVYLSPWDCNHADYGKEAYITYYRNQLRELLTEYGEVFEVWFDGANGGTGYYGGAREERRIDQRTYYEWPVTFALVHELQPMAAIFSDAGPDVRWVGNESGLAPETCWATVSPAGVYPGIADLDRLAHGDRDGTVWRPAEVDVSIRPGWFYHASEDGQVKSLEHLLDIYYESVGRGCNLLLNVPPDRRGLLHENDGARLMELGKVLRRTFAEDLAKGKEAVASNVRGGSPQYAAAKVTDGDRRSYWATDDEVTAAEVVVSLGAPALFDRVRLQEAISLGQRVEAFAVEARVNGTWQEVASGTTVGARRLLRFETVRADAVRLRITASRACPLTSTLEVYLAPARAR